MWSVYAKLQWRVVFNIISRCKSLSQCFARMGLMRERNWAQKQYDTLNKKNNQNVTIVIDDEMNLSQENVHQESEGVGSKLMNCHSSKRARFTITIIG